MFKEVVVHSDRKVMTFKMVKVSFVRFTEEETVNVSLDMLLCNLAFTCWSV